MKLNNRQWDAWYSMSAESRLMQTFFLVEANSFEAQCLWVEHARDGRVQWEQGHGYAVTVGSLDNRPVVVSIMWNRLNGRWVAFWHACSQVVDHVMIDAWLGKHFSGTWDNGTRRATCDAMNFHHCIHAMQDAEASTTND